MRDLAGKTPSTTKLAQATAYERCMHASRNAARWWDDLVGKSIAARAGRLGVQVLLVTR